MFGKVFAEYKNGNYNVVIMEDGTKIRYANDGQVMIPDYPETIDLCVTKRCSQGCIFCYEGCTPQGASMDSSFMSYDIFEDIPPYTEIAINGNDLDFPNFGVFLEFLSRKKCIVNMTVTIMQFIMNTEKITQFCKRNLVKSVGISLGDMSKFNFHNTGDGDYMWSVSNITNPREFFIHLHEKHIPAVFHAIAGITSVEQLQLFADAYNSVIQDKQPNLLILGYKDRGRGAMYNKLYSQEINYQIKNLAANLDNLSEHYMTIAFDNLACRQLDMKSKLSENEWNTLYMGEDGQFSMYIDAVNRTFSVSSMSPDNERYELKNTMTLKDIFKTIHKKSSTTDKPKSISSQDSKVLDNVSAPDEF